MNAELTSKITRAFCRAGLYLKKHSPEILMGIGAAGTVASAVLACKATLKVDEIKKEKEDKLSKIKEATETIQEYTEEDCKKDVMIVNTKAVVDTVKLYAPSVLLGAASLGCFFASHKIVHGRNVALAAAYSAVDKSFKKYRGRVVDRFGEKLDKELRYNIKSEEVEKTVVDEKGKEKKVKKTVDVVEPDFKPEEYSIFARLYDVGNIGWTKDPEQNKFFLLQQQRWANERLKSQGHLFLNDVYEELGFEKTKLGQAYGWIYDPVNGRGDNYVDFGIYDVTKKTANKDFINATERSIILDFNVDGNILDLLA